MSQTPNDAVALPDHVETKRERVRREGNACIVSVWQLLDDLNDQFGDRFLMSDETKNVLELIERVWEDRHIDQPGAPFIEFAWNERGRDPGGSPTGFKAMLRGQLSANPTQQNQSGT
jgi:hypothetical protein